ncbi:hypothetical protein SAMN02800694_1629 [Luteibacter sp. UNCMF331Sha3.1]|uniref:hypothetical protein n=1 Tax=Luteibacter sp. UNCMF331Sha3.1 TaxID=1502760 RepID=UPI0008C2B193|nr:hypothetical protein [Luteibacter sp. UNCMF331Sha3.1]SEM59092.1 hypothetical protein SAMN02800694_1629 [Luteibacter sp. UNCMF331Sha3.1]
MKNLLLQTTIEHDEDDWHIGRFGHLKALLEGIRDENGDPAYRVTARNRGAVTADDEILSHLHETDFDQLWLFAVDVGNGLTAADCDGISQFRRNGGAMLVTRDHMDLGCSICTLGGVGAAHHFHTHNLDPDTSRHCIDDRETSAISWPNYHSGANGDYQDVEVVGTPHPVLHDPESPTGHIRFLPSHPHEGAISAPPGDASSRVILRGRSLTTGRDFNLAVAFERSPDGGRAIAQSTFHHFADYNWDIGAGCPSFVSEAPGDRMARHPDALRATHRYVRNVASWLGGS